jgi:hypothetical protein
MLKAHVKITEHNEKLKKLKERLKGIKKAYVSIGVHEDAGEYEGGLEVFQVALWNEFGTETIPARSFFRSTLAEHEADINHWRADLLKEVIEGKITVQKALSTIGFRVRELIKNKINSNVPPENAPSTVAKKKAEGVAPRTLVETGLLLRSIEFKVVLE